MSIKEDQIAGTEQAIDKLVEAIGDRMTDHAIGKTVVDHQINQDLAAFRMLKDEWKELKCETL
jgi:enamine deaminase RidA (YjgF/YER057c/UK114 family)